MTNNPHRAAAILLLRRGMATLAECAHLASVSRQAVRWWAQQEGLDVDEARKQYLARLWAKTMQP